MKPTSTVADFIRRGREAGQDALGLAHDLDTILAMAMVQRDTFLRERDERSLRRWRELVAEVVTRAEQDPAIHRWLGLEHVRLGRAFKAAALEDATLQADAGRWGAVLTSGEREEVVRRFELDLMSLLTVAAAASGG